MSLILSLMLSLPREILPAICPDPGVAATLSRTCRDLAHLAGIFEITLTQYSVIAQSYFHTIMIIMPRSPTEGVFNYIVQYDCLGCLVLRGANELHWIPTIRGAGIKIYARARARHWIPLPRCSDVILACEIKTPFYSSGKMALGLNSLPAALNREFDEIYARIDPHTPPRWSAH